MRYTKKRVLIIVFVIWCILFFVFLCTPIVKPIIVKAYPIVGEIIFCFIFPGALIALLLGDLGDSIGWYLMHVHPFIMIFLICAVIISSPFFYVGIAYLIMRRMERYSLKNNGDIITPFGSNDKP